MCMKLTAKQLRFCQEYMLDGNAADAARRAGYSRRTARSIGHENLTKPDIAAEIAARQARKAECAEVTVAEVLAGLRRIAVEGNVRAWELLGKHIGMWQETAQGEDSWNRLTADAPDP